LGGLRVLHAYKVCHTEIKGGIPEAIRILTTSHVRGFVSRVLASRVRGFGRRFYSGATQVRLAGSFGTVGSMPIAPFYPFELARASQRADVVALHSPFPLNDLIARIGIAKNVAVVLHWHAELQPTSWISRAAQLLVKSTLIRADRIVVSSESLLQGSKALRAYLHKCTVIPFGIDTAFWSSLDDEAELKVKELASSHPRLVVSVGRLVSYKGFDVLIEALKGLDATAMIVGEGRQANRLRRMIARRGLSDRVFCIGNVSREELRVLLHAARVFVLPSTTIQETFGIAQLEAMAAGLPVVNTLLPTGVPTVARDGIEALTVPPRDPIRLAQAIQQLLESPQLAGRLGTAGNARAVAQFDQRLFIDRTHALYADCIEKRRSAGRLAVSA